MYSVKCVKNDNTTGVKCQAYLTGKQIAVLTLCATTAEEHDVRFGGGSQLHVDPGAIAAAHVEPAAFTAGGEEVLRKCVVVLRWFQLLESAALTLEQSRRSVAGTANFLGSPLSMELRSRRPVGGCPDLADRLQISALAASRFGIQPLRGVNAPCEPVRHKPIVLEVAAMCL